MLFFKYDSIITFSGGKLMLHPWSKHYAKTLGLQVTLGADSVVTGLELSIDRASLESDWMGLRDIAKNFLREEIDLRDSAVIDTLANEIEFVLDKEVNYGGGVPPLPATPTQDYAAFLGQKETATDDLPHTRLTLHNIDATEPKILLISMTVGTLAGPR